MSQRCSRCVMDDASDSTIRFDAEGRCNYCTEQLERMKEIYFPNQEGKIKLEKLIADIKASGKGKKYDCVMGISGGLDSSYLAYLGYKWGLRVLAIHINDGYDTEISKQNIEKLIKKTGFEYKTVTPDEEQFNELTKAYMYAGVPDLAVPQDNILFAFLYDCIKHYQIKYFLSGSNFALESILQNGNVHDAYDVENIKDIHRKFGNKPIDKLKFISSFKKMLYKMVYGIQTVKPLNYVDYNRDRAFEELKDFCGFEYYGSKHLENILTAFVQLYWFPKKFGVDKRTSHLSSMIISGQMTRDEALEILSQPMYDETLMNSYIDYIKKKMNISDAEFNNIMSSPTHQHTEYKCIRDNLLYRILYTVGKKILS